jgi:hypothetical protein
LWLFFAVKAFRAAWRILVSRIQAGQLQGMSEAERDKLFAAGLHAGGLSIVAGILLMEFQTVGLALILSPAAIALILICRHLGLLAVRKIRDAQRQKAVSQRLSDHFEQEWMLYLKICLYYVATLIAMYIYRSPWFEELFL